MDATMRGSQQNSMRMEDILVFQLLSYLSVVGEN